MSRSNSLSPLAPLLAMTLAFAGHADAAAPIDRWPGSVCQPIDAQSLANVLYNSAGAIANLSESEPAWIQCPIQTPELLSPGQAVVWTANFLTAMRTQCALRLVTPEGEIVGSATGSPAETDDPSGRFLSLNVVVEDIGAQGVAASVRCKLPEASAQGRPAGIITLTTQVLESAQP